MGIKSIAFVASALVLSTSVNAALVERLGGLAYYDTDADVTWLADGNYAQTSGYDSDGLMSWVDANTWAAQLTIGGVSGWRLPTALQPDASCSEQSGGTSSGFNCTGSEMGNLFYNVLGGIAITSINVTHNANFDLFSNIQTDNIWSATEYAPDTNFVWSFNFSAGGQGEQAKSSVFGPRVLGSWAVHSGDVSVVPVPASVWLFGSGLIGLIGIARRKA